MSDVDEVIVLRLCAGIPCPSSHAEKLEAVRILRRRGMAGGSIARQIHASGTTVAQLMAELAVAA